MKTGSGAVPLWARTEMAAEAWGTPPWVVEAAPGSARWLARFETVQSIRNFVNSDNPIPMDEDDE